MTPLFLDTSYLIDYLRGRPLSNKDEIVSAVHQKIVYYNGIILTELLSGARTPKSQKHIEKMLSGLTYLPVKYDDYKQAGLIRNSLFKKGFSMSTPDALIAVHVKKYSMKLITGDTFFIKAGDLLNIKVEILESGPDQYTGSPLRSDER
ncbi:MAG: PIN domain-containing protein [Candidatus Marinimicrobia bacterium]|nr:PIN domain-containing protein [Candidatus Neomarinimicrobiota bacterium]MCH7763026.1 PIN domain-containing protein [Candidatus Neomarinimicrobiota bacterium]